MRAPLLQLRHSAASGPSDVNPNNETPAAARAFPQAAAAAAALQADERARRPSRLGSRPLTKPRRGRRRPRPLPQTASVAAALQAYKARVDILSAQRRQLAALGAANGGDLDVQRVLLQKMAGLQALFVYLHGVTSIAVHATLLGPLEHAGLCVSAAPFIPALEHLHAAMFDGGAGARGVARGAAAAGAASNGGSEQRLQG
jgi:hypothetical protein